MRISIHNSLAEKRFSSSLSECFSISDDLYVMYDRASKVLIVHFYYNEQEREDDIITAFEFFKDGNFS